VKRYALKLGAFCFVVVLVVAVVLVPAGAAPTQLEFLQTYPLPPALSWADEIVAGPDGAMWFTQEAVNPEPRQQLLLGRMTTAGELSTRALPPGTRPSSLAVGPDAALWYAASTTSGAKLGRVSADAIDETPLPGLRAAFEIVTGPDRALWFTTLDRRRRYRVGRLARGGRLASFPVPGVDDVKNIVSGPGRALWIGLNGGVGRIDLQGHLRRFRLPIDELLVPDDLVAGPDGALWIAGGSCGCIMRMTTAGRVRSFVLARTLDIPTALAVGSDGAIWYSSTYGIGRITTTGEITRFALPSEDLTENFASGPDGGLWFPIVRLDVLALHDPSNGRSALGRIDLRSSAQEILVVRLTAGRLRGQAGRTLRIGFTTTRRATGTLQLLRGNQVVATAAVRADATSADVRLPRRPGSYRVLLRLGLPAQAASDESRVRVIRRKGD
jgi:virginiamycin B lyase